MLLLIRCCFLLLIEKQSSICLLSCSIFRDFFYFIPANFWLGNIFSAIKVEIIFTSTHKRWNINNV